MSGFTLYTAGGGPLLAKGLNAVAMLVNEGGMFETMVRLGLLTGALVALAHAMWQTSLRILVQNWALPSFMILSICFVPKTTVNILDATGPTYRVSQVPWMLGAVAGTTSSAFHAVTQKMEQAFSEVDDLQYTKTGMMFGSRLVRRSKMFRITDPVFNRNLKSFVNQCVTFAALRGVWYTVEDIRHSKDLWGLVSSKSNWVIHFPWYEPGKGSSMCPCQDGIDRFNAAWGRVIKEGFDHYGPLLYNAESAHASRMLKEHLPLAFEQMLGLRAAGEDIMKQQLMAYATMEAIDEKNDQYGNPLPLAVKRAHLSQEMTHGVLWGLAQEHLPALKAVLEVMIYALVLLIVPLVFLPEGYKAIANWVGLVFWVNLWTPLFSIIYGLVTFLGSIQGSRYVGAEGYSLFTSVGVSEIQKTMEGIAGGLAMSIPFLSYALVQGGARSFVTLASHLGAVTQGAASTAAHEGMTGNYSAGNLQFGNTQMITQSGFQWSRGASYEADQFRDTDGRSTMVSGADGGMQSLHQNNSQIGTQFSMDDGAHSSLMKQAESSHAAANQNMVSASQAEQDALTKTASYSLGRSHLAQNGQSWTSSETAEQAKNLDKVSSLIKDFARENKLTDEEATKFLLDASVGGKIGGIGGSAGMHYESGVNNQEISTKAQKFADENKLGETLRAASQSVVEGRHGITDEHQRRLADDVAGSHENSYRFTQEAQKHIRREEQFRNQASWNQTHGFSSSTDLTQEFVEWLSAQPAYYGRGPMGDHHARFLIGDPGQRDFLQDFKKDFMQMKTRGLISYMDSHPSASPEQVANAFKAMEAPKPVSGNSLEKVRTMDPGLNPSKGLPDSGVRMKVESDQQNTSQQISEQSTVVTQEGEQYAREVNKNLNGNLARGIVPKPLRERLSEKNSEEKNALRNLEKNTGTKIRS